MKSSATEVRKMPPNVNYNMPIYATVAPGVTPQQISEAVRGSIASLRSTARSNPSSTTNNEPPAVRLLNPLNAWPFNQ
jgi:hypothetical protein